MGTKVVGGIAWRELLLWQQTVCFPIHSSRGQSITMATKAWCCSPGQGAKEKPVVL